MANETCASCGADPLNIVHPWVAVIKRADLAPDRVPLSFMGPNGFVAVPMCNRCHAYPDQRLIPLKAHFFPRQVHEFAVFAAGNPELRG